MTSRCEIDQVSMDDLAACHAVETACFPPSEAASQAAIRTRIQLFPEGFLVARCGGDVVGLINGGATDKMDLADEAFKQLVGHDPEGENLVVFSLSVLPSFRGQGIARELVRQYCAYARRSHRSRILLLCKKDLIGFYQRLGFVDLGESASRHGGARWNTMTFEVS